MRRFRRKRYFVDPSLQVGYMVVIFITMVITGAVVYFSIWSVFLERISGLQAQTRVVLLFKEMVVSVFQQNKSSPFLPASNPLWSYNSSFYLFLPSDCWSII